MMRGIRPNIKRLCVTALFLFSIVVNGFGHNMSRSSGIPPELAALGITQAVLGSLCIAEGGDEETQGWLESCENCRLNSAVVMPENGAELIAPSSKPKTNQLFTNAQGPASLPYNGKPHLRAPPKSSHV